MWRERRQKKFKTLYRVGILLWPALWIFSSPLVRGQEVSSDIGLNLPAGGGLYEPLVFSVMIDDSLYQNPFDSADIELIGIFEAPSRNQLVIPGFWMQPYQNACGVGCSGYDLQVEGSPAWQIRFTPQEVGQWSYTLQVRDNGAVSTVHNGVFEVTPSARRGFIRTGANGRYFEYSNGEPYFAIGHNLGWSWDAIGGLETYDLWLRELRESGGNYARLYIDVPWFISLEWVGSAGDYRPSQKKAAELDVILERAAEYGVSLQLVLLWHQTIRTYTGLPVIEPEGVPRPVMDMDWDNSPYNVLNGGVLSGPSLFFTDADAQMLFRRRLRYIVARWGFSPQVLGWEIIDQIDRTSNYNPDTAGAWLQSTISYLRQMDQHGHLITASSRDYTPVIAENPLLDYSSAQFYQRRPIETVGDQVSNVINTLRVYLDQDFGPVLLTAYSLNPWFEPTADDPTGIHFQNTLWAAALSGAGGGGMSDWWDSYIIPQGLMRYYAPLASFTADIDWPNLNLEPAQAGLLADDISSYLPVRLDGFRREFAVSPQPVVPHTITADGVFPDLIDVPSFLYGQVFNSQFSQAQNYRVAPPVDTYLEIAVRAVSTQADARLVVQIDNVNAAEIQLRAGSRDTAIRIPLRAGEHTVTVDNLGDDWLELDYIEVGQLIAPARSLTLRDRDAGVVLVWLQHRDYTWDKAAAGIERDPIQLDFRLDRLPQGRYVAEIWDPLSGAVLGEEILNVEDDGILRFRLLPLDRQLAVRAIRQPDMPTSVPSLTATQISSMTPSLSSTPPVMPSETQPTAPVLSQTEAATPLSPRSSPLPTLRPFAPATNTPRP